jgi:hypothetical protein
LLIGAGSGLAKDIGSSVGLSVLITALPGLPGFSVLAHLALLAAALGSCAFFWWFPTILLRQIGGSTCDTDLLKHQVDVPDLVRPCLRHKSMQSFSKPKAIAPKLRA